jgi:hypothetical protein
MTWSGSDPAGRARAQSRERVRNPRHPKADECLEKTAFTSGFIAAMKWVVALAERLE